MGAPVDRPLYIPERISNLSSSEREDEKKSEPGLRRSSSDCINSRSISILAGNPSRTPPTATPCDSPKEVSTSAFPKELPGMSGRFGVVFQKKKAGMSNEE
jgi:hypothetical protein